MLSLLAMLLIHEGSMHHVDVDICYTGATYKCKFNEELQGEMENLCGLQFLMSEIVYARLICHSHGFQQGF